MKLHFEPNLKYQIQAIEAVCDLFRGLETCRTEFTVTLDAADKQTRVGFAENDLGTGNRLTLLDDELVTNLNAVQLRNGLPPTAALASGDFTVEMETGTGKTFADLGHSGFMAPKSWNQSRIQDQPTSWECRQERHQPSASGAPTTGNGGTEQRNLFLLDRFPGLSNPARVLWEP